MTDMKDEEPPTEFCPHTRHRGLVERGRYGSGSNEPHAGAWEKGNNASSAVKHGCRANAKVLLANVRLGGWLCVGVLSALMPMILLAQEYRDLRVVNGMAVDLGPVHKWLLSRKGERPMKHWKQVQVLELNGDFAGYARCVGSIENGPKMEILVAHLPPGPAKFLTAMKQRHGQIVALRAQLAADRRTIAALGDRYVYTPSQQVSITSGSRGGTTVDSEATRFADYQAALRNREQHESMLAEFEAAYRDLLQQNAKQTTFLAMFTGKKYSNLDIWDCGRKM